MEVSFFLGANSGSGFYSLYDDFSRDEGDFLYLIKGGAGCGKSSFMRKIAESAAERGFDVEYVLCSGDPESLDGIYIPKLQLGFADATAPHIIEPRLFGVNSCYVNLGEFCSRADNSHIAEYNAEYKAMYDTAYAYLSAASKLKKVQIFNIITENERSIAAKRARSAVFRELGKARHGTPPGRCRKRFISALSCMGKLCLTDSVNTLCKHVYLVDDRFGLGQVYLQEIADCVTDRCDDVILCPDPLCPDELDAVLLPSKSLGFIRNSVMPVQAPWRHVRLDALIPAETVKTHKAEIKRREKLCTELTDTAMQYLEKAKEYHDRLEAEYKPYIDFDALNAFTEQFIHGLFN